MNPFETISATQGYRQSCQDCIAIFNEDARTVVVVADGAGGSGQGHLAAQWVVREVKGAYSRIHSTNDWVALLRQIDCQMSDGESTAVVVDVRPYGIAGASVGDSRAVIVHEGKLQDLTRQQHRKPLLGSGSAEPAGLQHVALAGVLILGTDGFFNFANRDVVIQLASEGDFISLPRRCIERVRLPSGEYWDDIGIVAVRNRRPVSSRRSFAIPSPSE